MNLKVPWTDESSYAFMRDFGIWPDSIEERKKVLSMAYDVIDFYPDTDVNKQANKEIYRKAAKMHQKERGNYFMKSL